MIILFIFGLFEFLAFSMPLTGFNEHAITNEFMIYDPSLNTFSSTRIEQIHNPKVIFGYLSSKLGMDTSYKIDMGHPYIEPYPPYIIIIHAILFILFIISNILLLLHLKNRLKSTHYFFFGIVLFVIIKNVIDGGIFNHETLIFALPTYILFYTNIKNKNNNFLKNGVFSLRYLFLYPSFLIIFLFLFNLLKIEFLIFPYLLNDVLAFLSASFFCILLSLKTNLNHNNFKKIKNKIIILITILIIFVAVNSSNLNPRGWEAFVKKDFPLPEGSGAFIFINNPQVIEQLQKEGLIDINKKISLENYLAIRGTIQKNTTYYQLSKKINIHPNMVHIETNRKWYCDQENYFTEDGHTYKETIEGYISPCKILNEEFKDFSIMSNDLNHKITLKNKPFCLVNMTLILPKCAPNSWRAWTNILMKLNIHKFIRIIERPYTP